MELPSSTKSVVVVEEEEIQTIHLINKKIRIKSKDKNNTQLEFVIADGILEIIPGPTPTEETSSSTITNENVKVQKKKKNLPGAINDTNTGTCEQDPLQIPKVVKNIGHYLHWRGLASARATCKLWSRALKPYQTIRLSYANLSSFLQHQPPPSPPTATTTIEPAESPEESDQFFHKYHLHNMSFQSQEVSTFFVQYGKYMEKLRLQLKPDSRTTGLNLDSFRKLILSNTPNLKKFIISTNPMAQLNHDNDDDDPENPDPGSCFYTNNKFWLQGPIFTTEFPLQLYLPKLKYIKFQFYELALEEADETVFKLHEQFLTDLLNTTNVLECLSFEYNPNSALIDALEHKSNLGSLKTLKLNYVSPGELHDLIQMSQRNGLQLNELKFNVSNQGQGQGSDEDGTSIITDGQGQRYSGNLYEFLATQATCLKSLTVDIMDDSIRSGYALKIPRLHVLERLELVLGLGCINNRMKCYFEAGSIAQNFPCLRSLEFLTPFNDEVDVERDQAHMGLTNPNMSVVELRMPELNTLLKLYRLAELFPNLTKLDVVVDSIEVIQGLWNKWPQLESLTLQPVGDFYEQVGVDEALTGIPAKCHENCIMLREFVSSIVFLSKFKSRPGISDLKHLTLLDLGCGLCLSDVSVYFGLIHPLASSSLNYLRVGDTCNLSMETRAAIREKFGPQAYIDW